MDTVQLAQPERPTIALPAGHVVFLSDFPRVAATKAAHPV